VPGSSFDGTCSLSPVEVRPVEGLELVADGLQAFQGKEDGRAFEGDDGEGRRVAYQGDEEVLLEVGGNTDS